MCVSLCGCELPSLCEDFPALHPSSGPRSPPPPSPACDEWLRMNYINQQPPNRRTPLYEKGLHRHTATKVKSWKYRYLGVHTQVSHLYLSDSKVGVIFKEVTWVALPPCWTLTGGLCHTEVRELNRPAVRGFFLGPLVKGGDTIKALITMVRIIPSGFSLLHSYSAL